MASFARGFAKGFLGTINAGFEAERQRKYEEDKRQAEMFDTVVMSMYSEWPSMVNKASEALDTYNAIASDWSEGVAKQAMALGDTSPATLRGFYDAEQKNPNVFAGSPNYRENLQARLRKNEEFLWANVGPTLTSRGITREQFAQPLEIFDFTRRVQNGITQEPLDGTGQSATPPFLLPGEGAEQARYEPGNMLPIYKYIDQEVLRGTIPPEDLEQLPDGSLQIRLGSNYNSVKIGSFLKNYAINFHRNMVETAKQEAADANRNFKDTEVSPHDAVYTTINQYTNIRDLYMKLRGQAYTNEEFFNDLAALANNTPASRRDFTCLAAFAESQTNGYPEPFARLADERYSDPENGTELSSQTCHRELSMSFFPKLFPGYDPNTPYDVFVKQAANGFQGLAEFRAELDKDEIPRTAYPSQYYEPGTARGIQSNLPGSALPQDLNVYEEDLN